MFWWPQLHYYSLTDCLQILPNSLTGLVCWGGGVKEVIGNLWRIGNPWEKIFFRINIFTLYYETTKYRKKLKEIKTKPCYKYELVRPIANLPKWFVSCFCHEIYLKAVSIQNIITAFNYSYIHVTQFKRWLPV